MYGIGKLFLSVNLLIGIIPKSKNIFYGIMKLHEVPQKTWIEFKGHKLLFHHIDGFYSYCETESGGVVHIFAGAEVEIIKPPSNS